jgi:hypothetical protein
MKRLIHISTIGVLLCLAGCVSPPARPPGACNAAQTFFLEHTRTDHFTGDTNRLETVYWRMTDGKGQGALRNQPTVSGQILEWRSRPGAKQANFGIAFPATGDVKWTLCDPGTPLPTSGSQFPPDYQVVNAWKEGQDYVVRLQVTAQNACYATYKIVVPPFDPSQTKLPPYDYYMVDATLDISLLQAN